MTHFRDRDLKMFSRPKPKPAKSRAITTFVHGTLGATVQTAKSTEMHNAPCGPCYYNMSYLPLCLDGNQINIVYKHEYKKTRTPHYALRELVNESHHNQSEGVGSCYLRQPLPVSIISIPFPYIPTNVPTFL